MHKHFVYARSFVRELVRVRVRVCLSVLFNYKCLRLFGFTNDASLYDTLYLLPHNFPAIKCIIWFLPDARNKHKKGRTLINLRSVFMCLFIYHSLSHFVTQTNRCTRTHIPTLWQLRRGYVSFVVISDWQSNNPINPFIVDNGENQSLLVVIFWSQPTFSRQIKKFDWYAYM